MKQEKFGLRINAPVPRPALEIIEKLRPFDTGLLCDGMGNGNAMSSFIKPILLGKRIIGPALTVQLPLGDSMIISQAVAAAREGDVIVVDAHGTTENAVVGDVKYLGCFLKKIAGMVVDGAVRDIRGMREIGFPVWAKSVTCRSSCKNNPGEVNVPISCGGVCVHPGDIIAADDEGVVVIPPAFVDEVMDKIQKKEAMAEKLVAEVKDGKYLPDKFLKMMQEYGYQI